MKVSFTKKKKVRRWGTVLGTVSLEIPLRHQRVNDEDKVAAYIKTNPVVERLTTEKNLDVITCGWFLKPLS